VSECVFGTCKHITDLEEEVRVCNEARIQAERDMFSALDRDEAIATLRRTLHAQDDNVQRLERELSEVRACLMQLVEAWDEETEESVENQSCAFQAPPDWETLIQWREAAGYDTANAGGHDASEAR
jgi:predicted  nucleic acid-binding Zn-ribbon protein